MNDSMIIECGPADADGRRLVLARSGGNEHRDRFNTDDAFRRQKFAIAIMLKLGWAITPDQLAEVDTKLVSQADAEDARPTLVPTAGAESVCLADVPPTDVAWLWPGRIALGKVTLLAGDPGLGKSMVTLDMAARVSRVAAWPDEFTDEGGSGRARFLPSRSEEGSAGASPSRQPASVVLLSAEDDLADTIRPRLESHDADCSRIVAIQAIAGREEASTFRRSFDLGRDLAHLTETIDRLDNCRLVVIDPISAYLGRAAENANAEVRSLLGPLALLAADRQLAIVVVTHLRKEEGAAMYRTMGSLAFIAAARSAWMICKDQHDSRRRLLLPVKNNLATDIGGLSYTIEPNGKDGRPAVSWYADRIEADADTMMREGPRRPGPRGGERNEAAKWLHDCLARGRQPASEVREAALSHGFTYATLRRAFRELGGRATRDIAKIWWWSLPDGNPADFGIRLKEAIEPSANES